MAEKQPITFAMLESCFCEMDKITKKLDPVLSSGGLKEGASNPSATELEARLSALLTSLRGLSERIHI